MPDIKKHIDRNIPPLQRSVRFTQDDANEGDILLLEESLGHAARVLRMEASGTDTLEVRLNVRQNVFPRRGGDGLLYTETKPNLASGTSFLQSGTALIVIEGGTTVEFDHEMPVRDIELITVAGQFDIYAS